MTGSPYPFQQTDVPATGRRSARPDVAPHRPSPTWATSMIACCVLIGLLAAWVRVEFGSMKHEQNRAYALSTSAMLTAQHDEDLGRLMGDARTRLIPLAGTVESPLRHASLAWNETEQKGVLFAVNLPPLDAGVHYRILVVSDGGITHSLAQFDSRPGVSVYPFESSDPTSHVSRFEVRDNSAVNTPILSGDIH